MPRTLPTPLDVEFLVPRLSPDEQRMAFITASVATDDLCSIEPFVAALTLALSRWAIHTCDGCQAWTDSLEDFNVGDLSHYLSTPSLQHHLMAVGITNLSIALSPDFRNDVDHWHYDTVLIKPDLAPNTNA